MFYAPALRLSLVIMYLPNLCVQSVCAETGAETQSLSAVQSRYRWQYLWTHRARRKDILFMPSHVEADRPIADKTRWKSPRIFFQHLCPNSPFSTSPRRFLYARERAREKSDAKSDKPACKLRNGKSWFDIDSSARYDYKAIYWSRSDWQLLCAARQIAEVL